MMTQARIAHRDLSRFAPSPRIDLTELPSSVDGSDRLTLRFRLSANGPAALEAIRRARRSMIREEWTRGLEEGEPSVAEAVFTNREVLWEVPLGDRARCRETLTTLLARSNRLLGV